MWLVHRKDHRTCGLYTKYTICMLPMLLHGVCAICTISSFVHTLPNRDCEHEVVLYTNFSLAI